MSMSKICASFLRHFYVQSTEGGINQAVVGNRIKKKNYHHGKVVALNKTLHQVSLTGIDDKKTSLSCVTANLAFTGKDMCKLFAYKQWFYTDENFDK